MVGVKLVERPAVPRTLVAATMARFCPTACVTVCIAGQALAEVGQNKVPVGRCIRHNKRWTMSINAIGSGTDSVSECLDTVAAVWISSIVLEGAWEHSACTHAVATYG